MANFLTYAQWAGIATLVIGAIAGLAFLFQWGFRFRLVGATGFTAVLTIGLFALGVVPFTRTVVPGAVRFSTVYDTGAAQVVITVPKEITEEQLAATLRQAASDLYSPGRLSRGQDKVTIRARTVLHPQPGISEPLYLGQVRRSLFDRNDENMEITLYPESFAKLPKLEATDETAPT